LLFCGYMQKRGFSDLDDLRLVYRGNRILGDLFSKSVHSIRQLTGDEAEAKAFYRFLQNDRVTEEDIVGNMVTNCRSACRGRFVVCLQDTTEINLSRHSRRLKKDGSIGTTNAKNEQGLGFFVHPSLVVDAEQGIPYGYSDVRLWSRPAEFRSKFDRAYHQLPLEEKESHKWIEVSRNTQSALSGAVPGMVIVQDREGDIYEQFALIPDAKTDLLVRARTNRTLADKTKLFDCLSHQQAQGEYLVAVGAKGKRKKRTATLELRYRAVELPKTRTAGKGVAAAVPLYLIEAKEVGYSGADAIRWRLLTTIVVHSEQVARMCIEWYSWRWTIEEVFKILKKEGYNIEASELEWGASIRKLCLLILEVIVQLFLMRLAYAEPEVELSADSCFTGEEQQFLEQQIAQLEGGTHKQKNPYRQKDLKRYVWAIARLGGWKGYESRKHPGITTLWTGVKYFKAAFQGWILHRNVSTR
jgi:hypothetical protein